MGQHRDFKALAKCQRCTASEHGQQVQQGLQFLLLETGLRITNPHSVRVGVRDKDEAASVRVVHGHLCNSLSGKGLQAAERNRVKVRMGDNTLLRVVTCLVPTHACAHTGRVACQAHSMRARRAGLHLILWVWKV